MAAVCRRVDVPEFIIQRPKLNVGVRAARWSMPGGLIEPLFAVVAPVVDVGALRRLQGADDKRAMLLWNWINYGVWKRLVVDGEPLERLKSELADAARERTTG
jgi:hypothetical protein